MSMVTQSYAPALAAAYSAVWPSLFVRSIVALAESRERTAAGSRISHASMSLDLSLSSLSRSPMAEQDKVAEALFTGT